MPFILEPLADGGVIIYDNPRLTGGRPERIFKKAFSTQREALVWLLTTHDKETKLDQLTSKLQQLTDDNDYRVRVSGVSFVPAHNHD